MGPSNGRLISGMVQLGGDLPGGVEKTAQLSL